MNVWTIIKKLALTAPEGLAETVGAPEGLADWDGWLDSVGFSNLNVEEDLELAAAWTRVLFIAKVRLTASDGLDEMVGAAEGLADWDGWLVSVGFFEICSTEAACVRFWLI